MLTRYARPHYYKHALPLVALSVRHPCCDYQGLGTARAALVRYSSSSPMSNHPEAPLTASRMHTTADANATTHHGEQHGDLLSSYGSARKTRLSSSIVAAPPSTMEYLATLPKSELFSLGMIACVTLHKRILDAVIKVFPFMPISLVKLFVSKLYVGGDNPQEVKQCGERLQQRGISNMMLSLTIEDSEGTKNIDINYIVDETIKSVHTILKPHLLKQLSESDNINDVAPGYIALKPSVLVKNPVEVMQNFSNPAYKERRETLINNCSKIAQQIFEINKELYKLYPSRKAPFLVCTIDAEKYGLQNKAVYELQRVLFEKFNPANLPFVSCIGTWQLYLKDSAEKLNLEYLRAKRHGYKLGVKIVRGAYIHSESDRNAIIYESKQGTDENFDRVMTTIVEDLLNNGDKSTYGHLVVASHNYQSQLLATDLLSRFNARGKNNTQLSNYETGKCNVVLGQLLGMADNVTYDLIKNHNVKNIIKYVPWGPPIETKDYLLRRLQENGDAVRSDNGFQLLASVIKAFITPKTHDRNQKSDNVQI